MRATLGLSASFALAAHAMMIPSTKSLPELSSPSKNQIKGFSVVDPTSQLLKVDCAGCHFAQRAAPSDDDATDAGAITWVKGMENSLVLNISVGNDASTLELNGVRFYPPVLSLSSEGAVPYIPQIPAAMSLSEVRSSMKSLQQHALRLTSWAFQAGRAQTVSESGEELLTLHLQLQALERQPVSVPDVKITTVKNAQGELMIAKIEMADKQKVQEEECTAWPLLCKWRSLLDNKLPHGFATFHPHMFGGHKPCHGKGRGMRRPDGKHGWKFPSVNMHHGPHSHHDGAGAENNIEPDELLEIPAPIPIQGEDDGRMEWQHGRKHHGWRQGHHRHHRHGLMRVMHGVGRVALTVFVPVLLGVAAGMITYLLGVALGAVVAAVYVRFRGARPRYQAVALEEGEGLDGGNAQRSSIEKVGLLEYTEDEPLPVYVEKE